MLSSRVVATACTPALLRARATQIIATSSAWKQSSRVLRSHFHSTRLLQDETVKVPPMAESISEGTLKQWAKKVGESVEADEEVATIETDKIDVTVNAPKAGKITELLVNEEETVTVGQDLFKYEPGASGDSSSEPASKPTEDPEAQKNPQEKKDKEEPKDQQLEKGTPPPPTPEESKQKDDVQKSPSTPPKGTEKAEQSTGTKKGSDKGADKGEKAPPPSKPAPGSRNETRVKMSRMRLRIAERLKESQNSAASLTTFNEIDMSALMAMRSKFKDEVLKTHEVKLGFMSAFAKASCLALKEIPAVNASIEGDEIVYRDYVDLSIAVATPKGLVTPVVRNAESMGFVDIEREIAALGKKARDGKLTLEDMAGGTFTISNGGVFGSLYGTPIINLPQAAVLGMHSIRDRPVVVNGEIVIRPVMIIALTYDHRLIDGREGTTFLVKVRDYIENPMKMLL